jgi:hypothetical protein
VTAASTVNQPRAAKKAEIGAGMSTESLVGSRSRDACRNRASERLAVRSTRIGGLSARLRDVRLPARAVRFVIETRDPAYRGWEEWTRDRSHQLLEI